MKTLRKLVGQLVIAGVEGPELTATERSWLKMIEPGGLILFRRNIEEAVQTYRLLSSADAFCQTPLFRCVDLEGGLVDRLRDAVAAMPSLAAVGSSGKEAAFLQHGRLIGREARLLGFNVVLAPVLDLARLESRSVMRTRTCFPDGAAVAQYAEAFLTGLKVAGILGCGKHFPGLGAGRLDSHLATPVIERSWQQLWSEDLLPYRLLKDQLALVMVSHASYPGAGDKRPASISSFWIGRILKRRIGYNGLIVSDDMEMGGILSKASMEEAVISAVVAGTHLVEICKDASLVLAAYEAMLSEAEHSAAFRRKVEEASRRIFDVKKKLLARVNHKAPSQLQLERLRAQVVAFRAKYPEPSPTEVFL